MDFLPFAKDLSKTYGKQLLDTATKTWLNALKIGSKKVVHKAVVATSDFIRNKITEKIVKPDADSRNFKEIIIQPKKRKEILNELRQVL